MNRPIAHCLIGSFLTGSLFLFGLALPVKGETVLARIQRTGVLKLAVREDSPPLGYLDANNNLRGYCLDFFALLKKQLINNLERNTLSIKLLKSTPGNRFSLVEKNIVDLECGPNTIRSDISENIDFSQSFLITGTQFLIKQKNSDRINLEEDLDNIRLGVISNTTTEKFIAEQYPLAAIKKYSGVTARIRGIQGVEQDRIDAMVSDGILLRATAVQQGLSISEYPLIPEIPLTCDRYGMIIKGKDPQWRDMINSLIRSPEAITLSQDWFGGQLNYIRALPSFCEQ